ncbi:MAG: hypothetical protein CMH46_06525 [Muricauda sp.]|nr:MULTISPECIES: hypothetical protein [unclassified Allomuricauda]MAU15181.1 hypothetical protein [Allomuricauda sp.]|tara:strand:- start:4502 stop:4816 length:315 start_codon:yes stop_codon:yes gene_type:complete
MTKKNTESIVKDIKGRTRWKFSAEEKIRPEPVEMALDFPEGSCRGLACKMTDGREYYISESSVYRILKSRGLVTSPAFDTLAGSSVENLSYQLGNELWALSVKV